MKMIHPLFLSFISSLIVLLSANLLPASDSKSSAGVNCDIQHNACKKQLSDCTITFDVNPKPVKAMKDLIFRISLSGRQPNAAPYIDLGMPGMDMGPNRVILKHAGNGIYEGKGIIVRCPSGRRIWSAKVTVPGIGMTEFIFDVVY